MSHLAHPLFCVCVDCSAPYPVYAGKRGAARGLIERLARQGVSLRVVGDKIRIHPAGAIGEDLEQLRRLKPEVLALLSEDDARRRGGEGTVRDRLEAFELARGALETEEKETA